MALADLNRAQDTPRPTLKLAEVPVKNWHRYPPRTAANTPQWVRQQTAIGGVKGDDTDTATATLLTDQIPANGPNTAVDYGPRTQAAKATAMGTTLAKDVTSPRGWIEPQEPYGPAPVSPTDDPTITSLSPNTMVAGSTPTWVKITGTKFTPFSQVETGGVITPYSKYLSPTRIDMLQDPRSSAGTVVVKVIDHGVKSAGSNFTFT